MQALGLVEVGTSEASSSTQPCFAMDERQELVAEIRRWRILLGASWVVKWGYK